jgi:hypothetical protein
MLVGVLVSLLFAFLTVRDVDFDALREGLARSDYWSLLPAGVLLALAVFLRAVRWRLLLLPPYRPSIRVVTIALLIGYLFNTILPARAGEVARIEALKQSAGTPRFEALGTVAAERALDVLALLVIFFVTAPFLPEADWTSGALLLGGVIFIVLSVLVIAFALYGERPARLLLRPLAAFPGISRERTQAGAANLVRGFALFRQLRIAVPATGLTFASWVVIALSFWILLRGFDPGLGLDAAMLVIVATNLALVVPSGPAAVGVFEAATVVALAAFGVDRATALSYGVFAHALNALPFIPAGYVALHYHGVEVRRGAWLTVAEEPISPEIPPSIR